jgi:hypothetical protein
MTVKVDSGDVRKRLAGLTKSYPRATQAAVYQEALELYNDSILQCPVDTGVLRRSAYVAPPKDAKNPSAEVGYGTDYALPVHERLEVSHPTGNAQFLRRPFNTRQQNFEQRMADRIARNAERGIKFGGAIVPTRPRKGRR